MVPKNTQNHFFRTFHIGLHLTDHLVENVHLFVPHLHLFDHFWLTLQPKVCFRKQHSLSVPTAVPAVNRRTPTTPVFPESRHIGLQPPLGRPESSKSYTNEWERPVLGPNGTFRALSGPGPGPITAAGVLFTAVSTVRCRHEGPASSPPQLGLGWVQCPQTKVNFLQPYTVDWPRTCRKLNRSGKKLIGSRAQ